MRLGSYVGWAEGILGSCRSKVAAVSSPGITSFGFGRVLAGTQGPSCKRFPQRAWKEARRRFLPLKIHSSTIRPAKHTMTRRERGLMRRVLLRFLHENPWQPQGTEKLHLKSFVLCSCVIFADRFVTCLLLVEDGATCGT